MIRVFFGNPGCGKTTTAVRNLKKMILKKEYDRYFTNFESAVSEFVDLKDLGKWTFPEHSYLCIDEAGIEYNSRKYKSLSQDTIAWLKLHRHYRVDVDVISQSWEDMDITIRRLADQLWYLKHLGCFTFVRRIYKRVGIDKETHQIVDFYEFGSIITRFLPFPFHRKNWYLVFRPFHYKQFDSFSKMYLPEIYSQEKPLPWQLQRKRWRGQWLKAIKKLFKAERKG